MSTIVDAINEKSSRTGWGAQLLENSANDQKMTMAEAFLKRIQGRKISFIPAICKSFNLPLATYEFSDGSTADIDVRKIPSIHSCCV